MRVVIWGLAALLAGCGEKAAVKPKAAAPKAPRITQFYATETAVPKGGSVTLCYGTEDVETLTLRPSEGGELRPALTRCVSEPVKGDTTFTLTAKGPGGETRATFTVRAGGAAAKDRTLIQSFALVGTRQLCYSTEGASTVRVQPDVGVVLAAGKNQCFIVAPEKPTEYVLTATAPDGGVDRMQVRVPGQ